MKSIFWIGCILAILISLLASGAMAESVSNSTVKAAVAHVENVTDVVKNATANVTTVKAEPDLVNDTLVKFVTDARSYAQKYGKDAALASFNNPKGKFANNTFSIFAYDFDGKALALPSNPSMVGKNQIALNDLKGFRYVQQMRDTAKKGKGVGFVKYQEADMKNKGKITEKVAYVTNVDGNYWIGASVYKVKDVKPAAVVTPVKDLGSKVKDVNATADVKTVAGAAKTVAT